MQKQLNQEDDDDMEEMVPIKVEKKPEKVVEITMNLIASKCFDSEAVKEWSRETKIDKLEQLKVLHLQWIGINEIKNLDVFTNVENLFLQFNQITQIKNLDCLINLEYLALNGNQITKIQNLKHLLNLCFLNLAENQIEYLDEKELPKYLEFLNVSQNPLIQKDKDYEKKVISHLEYIEELNGIEITPHIKLQILGIYPKNVNGYEKTIHKDEDDEYQPTEEELKKLQQYEFDTRDGVVSLQDKTEKIVTKYKIDTQKELENIQNELQDYMILKQEIKQQVELNSKHAKNLGQSQFFE